MAPAPVTPPLAAATEAPSAVQTSASAKRENSSVDRRAMISPIIPGSAAQAMAEPAAKTGRPDARAMEGAASARPQIQIRCVIQPPFRAKDMIILLNNGAS